MQQRNSRSFSIDLSGIKRSASPGINPFSNSRSPSPSQALNGAWKKSKRLLPFVTPPRQSQRSGSNNSNSQQSQSTTSLLSLSTTLLPDSPADSRTLQPTLSLLRESTTMADFLERENEVLGSEFTTPSGAPSGLNGGDIDLDRAASAFPDISLDGIGDIPAPVAPAAPKQTTDSFVFDDFLDAKPPPNVRITGDDEIEKFEDQFPEIEPTPSNFSQPILSQQPSFISSPVAPRPQPSAFSSTPILQQSIADEEEPEVVRIWREKQEEEIRKREEASAARRQETITKAERSIDQFYEEYATKKERNIKENKQQEAEYLASLSDALSNGTTWSRICESIDLQNSQSKTLARTGAGTTDLTRFKEVLLRLMREGDSAPAAAGY